MSVVSRVAFKLPSVRALEEHARRLEAQRDNLLREIETICGQRDSLERERDEMVGHCSRLSGEARASLERERELLGERERIFNDREVLERERDELTAHCRRLEQENADQRGAGERLREQLQGLKQAHSEFVERALQLIGNDAMAEQMRRDWDDRAQQNAMYFTASGREDWDEEGYRASGEQNIREYIANDMENICQGMEPGQMRIVEIGCGAGRMTRALAKVFGEVHAVDISAEMIRVARQRLADVPNVVFHHNNGVDLQDLETGQFDFAMSFIVFQHIPSKAVIESYMKEVHRVLKPGRLFKFQVQGGEMKATHPLSTWLGASYTRGEMEDLAERNGFEPRYAHGEGTQEFWLWFFKKESGARSKEPE